MAWTPNGARTHVAGPWWVAAALLAWSSLWGAVHRSGAALGWHYFVTGVRILGGRDALHLYARHGELQIGPLALTVAAPFTALGPSAGEVAAMAAMQAAGLWALWAVGRIAPSRSWGSATAPSFLIGGMLFVPVWSEVAVHWAHLDDVVALVLGIVALRAAAADRYLLAAAAAAAAADAKPWAVGFLAVVLASPRWWRPALVAAAVLAVAWLPFVLADPGTLSAAAYRITVDRAAVIHLLGVHDAHTPSWCRPVQLLLIATVAVVVVARRRTSALIMVVVAARMLLDPATKNYYDAGLALGSVIYDLATAGAVVPWATLAVVAGVWMPSYLLTSLPVERGLLRAGVLVVLLVAGLVGDLGGRLVSRGRAAPTEPDEGVPADRSTA